MTSLIKHFGSPEQELLVILQQVVWIARKLVRLVGLCHRFALVYGPRLVGLCHHLVLVLGPRLVGLCHLLVSVCAPRLLDLCHLQPSRLSGLLPKSTLPETPEITFMIKPEPTISPASLVVTSSKLESTMVASPEPELTMEIISDDDALVEDLLGVTSDDEDNDSEFDNRPNSCDLVGLCHGSSKSAIKNSVIVPVVPVVPAVTVTVAPAVTIPVAPAVTVTVAPAAPVLNSSTFVEDLYDAIGDVSIMREYLLAAGLPPKVATKYLMELVVPKKPVVIKVGMLLREDYRKQTCAASWESPSPVYPHLTRPIRARPRSGLSQVVTVPVPVACSPALDTHDDDDESEIEDLIPETPSPLTRVLPASDVLAEGIDTPDAFCTPAWRKFPVPEAIPYHKVIFPTSTLTSASTFMSCSIMPITDDAEGLHWRSHPSGDIIMGREPRCWAPFGWDGPDGDIVMG